MSQETDEDFYQRVAKLQGCLTRAQVEELEHIAELADALLVKMGTASSSISYKNEFLALELALAARNNAMEAEKK